MIIHRTHPVLIHYRTPVRAPSINIPCIVKVVTVNVDLCHAAECLSRQTTMQTNHQIINKKLRQTSEEQPTSNEKIFV